jgi:hypothetical protein
MLSGFVNGNRPVEQTGQIMMRDKFLKQIEKKLP